MLICVDLDNTLFKTEGMEYEKSVPIDEMVNFINELYSRGNQIFIFTGRGSGSGIDYEELTKNQLRKAGVKYHKLITGKPPYDVFIDDRAIRYKNQSPKSILNEIQEITET